MMGMDFGILQKGLLKPVRKYNICLKTAAPKIRSSAAEVRALHVLRGVERGALFHC